MGVVFANIVNTKFIYYEIESEGVPFVEPEASCGDILVVAGIIEALGEEIIGDLSRLWKVVDALRISNYTQPSGANLWRLYLRINSSGISKRQNARIRNY